MKKKISILVLCFFMMTIFAGGAVAKNDNSSKGNKQINNTSVNHGQWMKFIDIDPDWAKDEIDKAVQKGYMKGYGDGKFQPNKPITCLEAIVALMSTLEQEGEISLDDVDVDSNSSLLKKIPDWGQVYVAAALDEGILLESEMKNFNPNQGIKRYQVAVYFARMTESGYREYIVDFIGDKEEWDFDLDVDSILQVIDEALEDLDEIIEEEDAEELNIDEFISTLEELQVNLEELDEADIDQDVIDEAVEDVDSLISELKGIIEDAEGEEFDDIVEALDEVLELLKGMKSELKTFTKTKDVDYFFNFNDEDQIPSAAKQSVKSMQKLQIMFGDTDGKFSPNRVVKRNELAAMLNRLDDNYFCQKDYELIIGILDDIDYDADDKIFTFIIIDEDGDTVDEIDFTDEDRLYFDGKLVSFDEDIDEEKYAAIEDIETGGEIKVYINSQDELLWAKIYPPEEE